MDHEQVDIAHDFSAFPDLHVTIEDLFAEGDKVCIRFTETATHAGSYRGYLPTGKKLFYTVIAIWRIERGKIVEGWVMHDQLDFLTRLGVVDPPSFHDPA